jgi:hypothetical protein
MYSSSGLEGGTATPGLARRWPVASAGAAELSCSAAAIRDALDTIMSSTLLQVVVGGGQDWSGWGGGDGREANRQTGSMPLDRWRRAGLDTSVVRAASAVDC